MDNPKTWLTLVAAVAILLWLAFAVRGPRKVETPNVLALLRYGPALRIFAIVLTLLPLMVLIQGIWTFRWRSDLVAAAAFVGANLIAGLLLIEVERVQIALTDEGLTRHSPWLGVAGLKWGEIESVRFSRVNQWFVVTGAGRTIRVSRYLVGVKTFAESVRTRVAAERWASAAAMLHSQV